MQLNVYFFVFLQNIHGNKRVHLYLTGLLLVTSHTHQPVTTDHQNKL